MDSCLGKFQRYDIVAVVSRKADIWSKGDEFDETTEVPTGVCFYWTEGSDRKMEWDLWSCSLDQAPEKENHERKLTNFISASNHAN